MNVSELLSSGEAYATTLLLLAVDAFGTECTEWLAETLSHEMETNYRAKLSRPTQDRLMTAISLVTTDLFYKSLPDFVMFCNVLSGDTYNPDAWDPADAEEIAWGITETLLISPPDETEPFVDEITAYIGKVLDAEGIIKPPDVLKIAVRERDPAAIAGAFSDDPMMFDSLWSLEAAKTEAINRVLKSNMIKLAHQLSELPLRNGSAREAIQKVLQAETT